MNRLGACARVVAVTLLLGVNGKVRAEPSELGWEPISQEAGIALTTRHEPGHKTATFRAHGEVVGSLWHVLAIVMDDGRAKEWAKAANDSRVIRRIDLRTQIVYARSYQTWPVRDRDLVMRRTLEVISPGSALRVRLTCIPGEKPERDDALRIRDCETSFLLRKVDDARTLVEFRMRADAGAGPEWLTKLVARRIPLDTLLGLRKQVQKTPERYRASMQTLERGLSAAPE
jgi:hypothetical protein